VSYNRTGWFTMLFVFVVISILVGAGLVVSAQEETTRGSSMTSNATTTTNTSTHRRSRRGSSRNANMTNTSTMSNENTGGTMQENTSGGGEITTTGTMSTGHRRRGRRGRRHSRAAASAMANANAAMMTGSAEGGEQTDLSGTYTGTFNCSDAGANGDGTLTISGNTFTWTSGSDTKSGRITAVTTRGYTGIAMQFGEATAPAPGQTSTPPMIISMRAKKMGDRLMLMTVPGAGHACSFTPSGGASSGGGHRRHSRRHRSSRHMNNMGGNMNSNTTPPGGML